MIYMYILLYMSTNYLPINQPFVQLGLVNTKGTFFGPCFDWLKEYRRYVCVSVGLW